MKTGTFLIVLAAGLSKRFGEQNKLLAEFQGLPLASYSSDLWAHVPGKQRIAVIPPDNRELTHLFQKRGWTVIYNDNAQSGQSSSIRLGVKHAAERNANEVIIALADMPLISDGHLDAVSRALQQHDAVMSTSDGVSLPPSGFSRKVFGELMSLSGDQGAKSVFQQTARRTHIALPGFAMRDVDTIEDLSVLNAARSVHVS